MSKQADLIHFIQENQIDTRWDGVDNEVLSAWLMPEDLREFSEMFASSLEDGGLSATILVDGYIHVDLVPLCGHYGIEPTSILRKPRPF